MSLRVCRVTSALGVAAAMLALSPNVAIQAQAPTASTAPAAQPAKTAWGHPDLQGIWTATHETPLQRPEKYANQEFFTEEQIAELNRARAAALRLDDRNRKGSEGDVAGAYNALFFMVKPTGRRTSLIVDPPNGRIPPYTPEALKRIGEFEEYRLALMQATLTCKEQLVTCRGGQYGPPSPRRAETPPMYNTTRLNRSDGPEDRGMPERCMAAGLPDVSGYYRIVQSPEAVSIFYDVGQGQGWERVIPITNRPHLPKHIRQWWGDSRGRWDGNTLVVDVTNFSPKSDFLWSRENLHLIERWTRLDANTIEYAVTIDDPTTWTRSWTIKQEMSLQDGKANRIYYEPRCHEGNFGMAGMLVNTRAAEAQFAKGQGPDPATQDNASGSGTFFQEENVDVLTGRGTGVAVAPR